MAKIARSFTPDFPQLSRWFLAAGHVGGAAGPGERAACGTMAAGRCRVRSGIYDICMVYIWCGITYNYVPPVNMYIYIYIHIVCPVDMYIYVHIRTHII